MKIALNKTNEIEFYWVLSGKEIKFEYFVGSWTQTVFNLQNFGLHFTCWKEEVVWAYITGELSIFVDLEENLDDSTSNLFKIRKKVNYFCLNQGRLT